RVPALFAGCAERELLVLPLLRLRIPVGGGEFNLVAAGTKERAGRFAQTGRDALAVAGREIERVDLIEGITRLALALKDEALAVGRPVAFSGAASLDGETADAAEEIALLRRAGGLLRRERRDEERQKQHNP